MCVHGDLLCLLHEPYVLYYLLVA
uniref:Uncharacterized protein n=1 Tax=Rhizophora mucronata TaxID=61149 RepID=A0A2P2P9P0_RHIMU